MKHEEYIDLGITSSKLPYDTHLWWQHDTYGIYMIDSTNRSVLLQSTLARLAISGSDWTVVDLSDNTYSMNIQAGYLDGNDLWLLMCQNTTGATFEVCYIELDDSDDCNPVGVGTISYWMNAFDLFKISGTMYAMCGEYRQSPLFETYQLIYDVSASPVLKKRSVDLGTLSVRFSYGAVAGTSFYSRFDEAGGGVCKILEYDSVAVAINIKDGISNSSEPDSGSNIYDAMMYDGNNLLYFLLAYDLDSSKRYLHRYSISGDEITRLGRSDNIIMLDRNTAAGLKEKAYNATLKKVYQLYPNTRSLYLIADVIISDQLLKGITDYLLINTDGDLFQWTKINSGETITGCEITYATSEPTIGTIVTDNQYATSQILSFYDDDETIIFKGKIKKKQVRSGIRSYDLLGLDKEIINNRFTKVYSGQTVKYIMEDLIDSFAYNIHYESGTIHANLDVTVYSLEFDNKTFQEAFDTLMDLQDGIYWITPDFIVYAYKLADIPSTGDTIYRRIDANSDHIIGVPKYSEFTSAYNKVHIYGGISGTARLESTANDVQDQQENGILEFVGHYPHIRNQTDLNTLATAILNRTGMINPIYVNAFLNITFRQVGKKLNFEFDGYEELEIATDYYILSAIYYPLSEEMEMTFSSGLIQEGREYTVELHQTSHADEEQIDIVAAAVGGGGHAEIHVLATTGPHTGTLPWTDLSKTGSNLTDLVTRQHAGLTDITANQHIDNLTDIPTRNHNDLLNIDAGDINHLTDDQVSALHTIYSLEVHNNDEHDPNYSAEGHDHIEADITDLDHDALKLKGKTIDDAALADDKILRYDLSSQQWKCEDISVDAQSIKGITVDDTDIENNKILKYNSTSGNLEYEIDDTGAGFAPPIGFIAMFSGSWTDNSTIPGWYKCDGNNGTVNLVDKFVRGGATSGATGGSDNAIVVNHWHSARIIGPTSTQNRLNAARTTGDYEDNATIVQQTGVSGTGANKPAYYTLVFIQRIS